MEFLEEFSEGFPSDYFDDVKMQLVRDEPNLLFVKDAFIEIEGSDGKYLIESTGIFSASVGDEYLTTGYKYPQKHNYEVPIDLAPVQIVFDWTEAFYTGQEYKLPHLPVADDKIPPSRYQKSTEFNDVYQYFINLGYNIYGSSMGQQTKFPDACVDRMDDKGKYIVNNYGDFKSCQSKHCIMLDFNPYNPLSVMSVKSVCVLNNVKVKYERVWKDKEITGIFRKNLKRYHYDCWGDAVLGEKYYLKTKISGFDIVVKSYKSFESDVKVKLKHTTRPTLSDPILVDTYPECVRAKPWRSGLRYYVNKYYKCPPNKKNKYRTVVFDDNVRCLPWSYRSMNNDRWSTQNYCKSGRMFKYREKMYDLATIHSHVKYQLRKGMIDKFSDIYLLSERVFVLRSWTSVYDGEVVKRDKLCNHKFISAYVRQSPEADEHVYDCSFEFVPYKIGRCPVGRHGSLVANLFEMTIEEYVKSWAHIYKNNKFPGWLEKHDGSCGSRIISKPVVVPEDQD